MNIKEAIEFLESSKDNFWECNVKYDKKIKLTKIKVNEKVIDIIIKLLKHGGKCEQILNELENCLLPEQYKIVEVIKQKYFPKED